MGIGLAIALTIGLLVLLAVVVLLIFCARRAKALLTPQRKPLASRPDDVGLIAEDVRFPGPQGTLAGWYVPSRNGCTLICCHGINDTRGQWVEQVARLRERSGYGALLLDFSGHGDSDGGIVTYGSRETQDVGAALHYLRSRGDVEMARIGILGYSLGAITATLAAAQMPELRCVVIESGFADLKRDISMLFRRFTGLPPFPFANLIIFFAERMSGVRLAEIRPASVIGRISPRPVFIIADLDDDLANEPYDGEHLFASAGEPKRLWLVEGSGHVKAFETIPDEWVRRVGDFLDHHLLSAPASTAHSADSATMTEYPHARITRSRTRCSPIARRTCRSQNRVRPCPLGSRRIGHGYGGVRAVNPRTSCRRYPTSRQTPADPPGRQPNIGRPPAHVR